jgi:hypothetical protein
MDKNKIKWILGYVDNYGCIHFKVVKHNDRLDSHNAIWPGPRQNKWRWVPEKSKHLNTYSEPLDFEAEDKIWEIIDKSL